MSLTSEELTQSIEKGYNLNSPSVDFERGSPSHWFITDKWDYMTAGHWEIPADGVIRSKSYRDSLLLRYNEINVWTSPEGELFNACSVTQVMNDEGGRRIATRTFYMLVDESRLPRYIITAEVKEFGPPPRERTTSISLRGSSGIISSSFTSWVGSKVGIIITPRRGLGIEALGDHHDEWLAAIPDVSLLSSDILIVGRAKDGVPPKNNPRAIHAHWSCLMNADVLLSEDELRSFQQYILMDLL